VLYDFLTEYDRRILAEKKNRGICDFTDNRRYLLNLLRNSSGEPSGMALEYRDRFDEVYIDEYQDVDYLQDRIFSIIGEGRRFMVGDIKQSIYGFRGSEPSIFSGYRRSMPLHDAPEAESSGEVCVFMSENFRCDRPVIDFANSVCSFLFSACEDSVGYRPEDDLKCGKLPPEEAAYPPIDVQTVVFEPYPKKKKNTDADEDNAKKPRREAVWIAAEIAAGELP
jgi:ATP-dependent helicase/nuclease subunit A